MDIGIGFVQGDNKEVNKNYTELTRVSGVKLMEGTNVVNPVFIFALSSMMDDNLRYNYLRWFKADRWYYIDNIVFNGALVELHCTVDMRMSAKKTIKQSTQFVDRQENTFNKQLFDAEIPLESKPVTNVYRWNKDVGDSTETTVNYVLITNGKER